MSSNAQTCTVLPVSGLVTIDELVKWLGLKHRRALQEQLDSKGIHYEILCGKRFYRCADLNALFDEKEGSDQ